MHVIGYSGSLILNHLIGQCIQIEEAVDEMECELILPVIILVNDQWL